MTWLESVIDGTSPGGRSLFEAGGVRFVLYYDEQNAYGDSGRRVAGDVTGDYELWEQVGDDDVRDLKIVRRVHVGPHGSSGYGNANAKFHAVQEILRAVQARVAGA